MSKVMLHLSIDPDLVNMAKASGMNLSGEFEEWIKIRLNQSNDNQLLQNQDTDKEIIKLQAEISKLQSKKEIEKEQSIQGSEEIMIIDDALENMKAFKESFEDPEDLRIHGLQFLFKKKFHKELNPLQARELLINRAKEKGFL
jgi:hypothetical protein